MKFSLSKALPKALSRPPDAKSAPEPAPLVALELARRGVAAEAPAGFAGLSREGYRSNPVVYRCVRLLSETAASVPLKVGGREAGAVEALLGGTSPTGGVRAVEAAFAHLAMTGSAYLRASTMGERPVALHALRPDGVRVATDPRGRAVGWVVEEGGAARRYRFDPVSHRSPILAMHLFDPLDAGNGRGPLEACAGAVSIHNEGAKWTRALLGNAARPSGALVYSGPPGAERLSDAQFQRLRSELADQHTGAGSAGRPLLLEGGLDWRPMSLSPADMDFIEARREAAREIALAFGVPPMLLGIPGDNTYSNYREANLALWRQTVVPSVQRMANALGNWLRPWLGDDIALAPDLDAVPALGAERDALWARLGAADFLSDGERRAMAGLAAGTLAAGTLATGTGA